MLKINEPFSRLRWICEKPKYTKHAIGLALYMSTTSPFTLLEAIKMADDCKETQLLIELIYVLLSEDFSYDDGIVPVKLTAWWNEHRNECPLDRD